MNWKPLCAGVIGSVLMAGSVSAAPSQTCPPVAAFNLALDHLEGYRVFTGPEGTSQVEPVRIDARKIPILKTGAILGVIDLPTSAPRGVQIVIGPPNLDLPLHPTPYKEMFVMLGGSITLLTKTFKAELGPGSVLIMDDKDSKDGHGGRTGPCGYISVSIAP